MIGEDEFKVTSSVPPTKINYKALDGMCHIHCTGEECAALLGMSYNTLDSRLKTEGHGGFLEYFKKKSAGGKMSLRRRQYKAAVEDGNVPMMIWMGKQLLGQSDKKENKTELTGKDGEPVKTESTVQWVVQPVSVNESKTTD